MLPPSPRSTAPPRPHRPDPADRHSYRQVAALLLGYPPTAPRSARRASPNMGSGRSAWRLIVTTCPPPVTTGRPVPLVPAAISRDSATPPPPRRRRVRVGTRSAPAPPAMPARPHHHPDGNPPATMSSAVQAACRYLPAGRRSPSSDSQPSRDLPHRSSPPHHPSYSTSPGSPTPSGALDRPGAGSRNAQRRSRTALGTTPTRTTRPASCSVGDSGRHTHRPRPRHGCRPAHAMDRAHPEHQRRPARVACRPHRHDSHPDSSGDGRPRPAPTLVPPPRQPPGRAYADQPHPIPQVIPRAQYLEHLAGGSCSSEDTVRLFASPVPGRVPPGRDVVGRGRRSPQHARPDGSALRPRLLSHHARQRGGGRAGSGGLAKRPNDDYRATEARSTTGSA